MRDSKVLHSFSNCGSRPTLTLSIFQGLFLNIVVSKQNFGK
jgi:hypothetical protein